MPRVDRRKKPLGRGSEEQRDFFLFGDILPATAGEPVFASAEQERAAWFSLRDELLRACRVHSGAGRRPHAYFKFELSCAPRNWAEEIAALLQRDLIDASEAAAIEQTHQILAGDQSPSFCSSFETPEGIALMQLGDYVLKHCADEFELASRWHAWRGRAELAQRYRARAETVRGVEVGKP